MDCCDFQFEVFPVSLVDYWIFETLGMQPGGISVTDIERLDVIIRRVGDGYVAGVPTLGMYTRAPTAAAALAALEARRTALSEEIEATGIVEPFPQLVASQPHPRLLDSLGLFAAKTLIVFILLTAAIAGSGAFVIDRASHSAGVPNFSGGPKFWAKFEEDLHTAAGPGKDLPEAKKQQLLSDIRAIVTRWRPFVAEIAPLFDREPRPASTNTCQ